MGLEVLFEKVVVGLFGGADFDGLHHFAGGDDDAAEGFWRGTGHGVGLDGVWDGIEIAMVRRLGGCAQRVCCLGCPSTEVGTRQDFHVEISDKCLR